MSNLKHFLTSSVILVIATGYFMTYESVNNWALSLLGLAALFINFTMFVAEQGQQARLARLQMKGTTSPKDRPAAFPTRWRDAESAPPGDYVDPVTARVLRKTETRWYRVYDSRAEDIHPTGRVFGPIPIDVNRCKSISRHRLQCERQEGHSGPHIAEGHEWNTLRDHGINASQII